MPANDWNDMDCSRWRDALSAMADGEPADIDARLIAAHVARCPACRSYKEMIESTANVVSLPAPHGDPPDLSKKISRLNAAADRAAHWSVLRIVLAVVAVQVIAFALPALVLGEEQDTATHAARHLGAFGVAYGVALIVVVVRVGARRRSGHWCGGRSGQRPHPGRRRGTAPPTDHQRLPDLVAGGAVTAARSGQTPGR